MQLKIGPNKATCCCFAYAGPFLVFSKAVTVMIPVLVVTVWYSMSWLSTLLCAHVANNSSTILKLFFSCLNIIIISAGADGDPRSGVCAR